MFTVISQWSFPWGGLDITQKKICLKSFYTQSIFSRIDNVDVDKPHCNGRLNSFKLNVRFNLLTVPWNDTLNNEKRQSNWNVPYSSDLQVTIYFYKDFAKGVYLLHILSHTYYCLAINRNMIFYTF